MWQNFPGLPDGDISFILPDFLNLYSFDLIFSKPDYAKEDPSHSVSGLSGAFSDRMLFHPIG